MKRIQVKGKEDNSGASSFLNVLRDREKRSTVPFVSAFPNMWKIVFGGCLLTVMCVTLFYFADPVLASEWSSAALEAIPFNATLVRTGAHSTVVQYSNYIWSQSNGTKVQIATDLVSKQPPLPPLREGFKSGFVTHQDDFDFVWQPPLRRSTSSHGGGIVFIAPACKRPATGWFPKSDDCPSCSGMPVQVNIVNTFRSRGFAVLVMSPVEMRFKSQCWHQNDKLQVGVAMQYVRDATIDIFASTSSSLLQPPPMYAIGIENGGVFLGNFAETLGITYKSQFSAACWMNAGIWHMNMKASTFPAVVFLDLARNGDLCEHNNATIQKLHNKGIAATQFYSEPRPINKNYFVAIMSAEKSTAYQQALIKAGFIWPASNVLLKDPGTERYRYDIVEVLRNIAPEIAEAESSTDLNTPLMQLLRLAWGYKEVNDDQLDKVIDWFESHSPLAPPTVPIITM